MVTNNFTIYVTDAGDMTVGISPLTVLEAKLDINLVEAIKEFGTMNQFKQELEMLVRKYLEPDTGYDTYDSDDLEAEAKAEEDAEKAYLQAYFYVKKDTDMEQTFLDQDAFEEDDDGEDNV